MALTTLNNQTPDPRWKDMYRVGSAACLALLLSITFAIIAFFIWPYKAGGVTVEEIFILLHNNRMAGLMSLELQMLLIQPVMVLTYFALFAALKQINESFALIALTLGIMSNILMITARPVHELIYLSDLYFGTASDMLKNRYLLTGDTFLTLYEGTTWTWSTILMSAVGVINAVLMLKSRFFSKIIAYIGGVSGLLGVGIFIPGVGPALSLAGTACAVIWSALLARTFFNFGWSNMSK